MVPSARSPGALPTEINDVEGTFESLDSRFRRLSLEVGAIDYFLQVKRVCADIGARIECIGSEWAIPPASSSGSMSTRPELANYGNCHVAVISGVNLRVHVAIRIDNELQCRLV